LTSWGSKDFLALPDVEKPILTPYEIGEDFLSLADIEKSILILGKSKLGESTLALALLEESLLRGGYSCGREQLNLICVVFVFLSGSLRHNLGYCCFNF
jgi:hypothetical protein